jgi:D-aspartate ligase
MNALACVIGDLSLVRPLGRAGIAVALVTSDPASSHRLSRYCRAVVPAPSFVDAPEEAIAALCAFGATQAWPSVLFPQGDHDLLAISRHRDALAVHFRFALPSSELLEDLVDKRRFAGLAARRRLPAPRTLVITEEALRHDGEAALADWSTFPCVLKPAMRTHWFDSRLHARATHGNQKAIRVERRGDLLALATSLREHKADFILQQEIPGGEDRILSYHAYVTAEGEIAGEFTGRKVRTAPRRFGLSSCVEITDDTRVRRLGRDILAQLGFTGVVKLDFKEHADTGRLYLLEANPRFNLWHHPGAVAGVNLPALVYADLTGARRAAGSTRARAGVRWMAARDDFAAMREYRAAGEVTLRQWLWDVARADIREDLSFSDPLPTLRDGLRTLAKYGAAMAQRLGTGSRALAPSKAQYALSSRLSSRWSRQVGF